MNGMEKNCNQVPIFDMAIPFDINVDVQKLRIPIVHRFNQSQPSVTMVTGLMNLNVIQVSQNESTIYYSLFSFSTTANSNQCLVPFNIPYVKSKNNTNLKHQIDQNEIFEYECADGYVRMTNVSCQDGHLTSLPLCEPSKFEWIIILIISIISRKLYDTSILDQEWLCQISEQTAWGSCRIFSSLFSHLRFIDPIDESFVSFKCRNGYKLSNRRVLRCLFGRWESPYDPNSLVQCEAGWICQTFLVINDVSFDSFRYMSSSGFHCSWQDICDQLWNITLLAFS